MEEAAKMIVANVEKLADATDSLIEETQTKTFVEN